MTASSPASTAQRLPHALPDGVQGAVIDGVPVLWKEMPGPTHAMLSFRVGKLDETLATSGITHAVEHLALSSMTDSSYQWNGVVEERPMVFAARGTQAEVSNFLGVTTAALSSLPLDRFDQERRVLRIEDERQPVPAQGRLLALRYGPRGPGLLGYDEAGLRRLTADEIAAWAAGYFCAGNAVLFLTTAPPAELRLGLPDGAYRPSAGTKPVAQNLPAAVRLPSSCIALSAVIPRTDASRGLAAVLQSRAHDHLRALGATYGVVTNYMPIDADTAILYLGADTSGEAAATTLEALLGIVDSVAGEGPSAGDLSAQQVLFDKARGELNWPIAVLERHSRSLLFEETIYSDDDFRDSMTRVTPGQMAGLLDAALGTSLWLVPPGPDLPPWRFKALTEFSPTIVPGHPLPRLVPRDHPEQRHVLVAGDDGISLTDARGGRVTVRFSACEAVYSWDGGERVLVGSDGFRLRVDPLDWRHGDKVRALIDAHVPEARRIVMGPSPERQENPAAVEQIRRLAAQRRRQRVVKAVSIVVPCILLILVIVWNTGRDTTSAYWLGPALTLILARGIVAATRDQPQR